MLLEFNVMIWLATYDSKWCVFTKHVNLIGMTISNLVVYWIGVLLFFNAFLPHFFLCSPKIHYPFCRILSSKACVIFNNDYNIDRFFSCMQYGQITKLCYVRSQLPKVFVMKVYGSLVTWYCGFQLQTECCMIYCCHEYNIVLVFNNCLCTNWLQKLM